MAQQSRGGVVALAVAKSQGTTANRAGMVSGTQMSSRVKQRSWTTGAEYEHGETADTQGK